MLRPHQHLCSTSPFGWLAFFLAAVFVLSTFAAQTAQAQTLTVLHEFAGGVDGANPSAGLTLDRAGELYGTSSGAAQSTIGTVFRITPSNWLLEPVYKFVQFNHGLYPNTRLIFGPDGSLYGTTWKGGGGACAGEGCGVIFKLQPPVSIACRSAFCPWTQTVLYTFTGGPDGWQPGPVILDAAGNIYGNTYYGGTGADCQCGTVYELKLSGGVWKKTILHSFDGPDGGDPDGPLVLDRAGNLYGTTIIGGSANKGLLYELSPGVSWTQTVLHSFQGSDGVYPNGGLIADTSGELYGVTADGGSFGLGSVFRLMQPGNWTFESLYSFTSYSTGGSPHGPLVFDSAGNLYGITDFGAFSDGTVFKLTFANQSWVATDLHDFIGTEGTFVNPGLIIDTDGNLYGTAFGNSNVETCYPTGCGTVWEITR